MDQLEHKQNSSTHQVHRQLYSIKEDLIYDLAVLLADAPDQKQSQLDYDAFETKLREILEPLHTADFADLLELLSNKQRTLLFSFCVNWINPEVLTYLDEQVSEHLFDELDDQTIARFLTHLESDDAIELIGRLNETRQQQLLRVVPAKDRALFQQSLNFPDQSAGRLMRREAVAIPAFWTVGQTIDYLRANAKKLPDVFYNLMIVGSSHKPIGIISASNLLSHDRQKPLARLFERDMLKLIPVLMNQEDVVLLFRQYGLVESPVIDEAGRLIGTITIDDIVNVMDEIHEEDLLKLGGVASDDFYADMFLTLRKRFTWLMINLLTAILASIVIGVFEVELEKAVALAILMPIVA
ncbi:MAG: CBS domain-containing protein, partial [Pseudomonadota bacterium]